MHCVIAFWNECVRIILFQKCALYPNEQALSSYQVKLKVTATLTVFPVLTNENENAMPNTAVSELPGPATIILWSARILTFGILGFWGFFIVGHLVGDAGDPSRPLTAADYVSLTSMIASLFGLGLALKWERFGATITLIAVAVGALVNWRTLMFPITLIPITGVMFLIYSTLRRTSFPGVDGKPKATRPA